jgi:hypothetical protein
MVGLFIIVVFFFSLGFIAGKDHEANKNSWGE